MFWTVMTVIAAVLFVTYGVIGRFGRRWGLSSDRARKFRNSSYLAAGWTAVCLAHYLLRR